MDEYDPYAASRVHAFHQRRRRAKKASLVLLLLGWIGPLLALFVLGYAWAGPESARTNMLRMAAGLAGGGLLCFLIRWPLESYRARTFRPYRSEPAPSPEKGWALLLVLLLLAAASLLTLEGQIVARHSLRREAQRLLDQRLEWAASQGARTALQRLADDEDLAVDHTNEHWAAAIEQEGPDGIVVQARVEDVPRYFDLNNLAASGAAAARWAPEILMDLMTLAGDFEPVGRTDALLDWMDDNQTGAWENDYYGHLDPPYEAANRRLYTGADLLWARGFSRDYFVPRPRTSSREAFSAQLPDCLAVWPVARSQPLPVNVNTASPEVLQGVFGVGQEAWVRTLIVQRIRVPIRSLSFILATAPPGLIARIGPFLDVRSSVFRVHVLARQGSRTRSLLVLAQRTTDGQVRVEQWVVGGGRG